MPAHTGSIVIVPVPGRKYRQDKIATWDADVRKGEVHALLHRDLVARAIYAPCSICGHPDGSQRCDYPVKEKNGICCDRLMCRACAVHIPTKNDRDYCPAHAKEAGVILNRGGFHVVL